MLIRFWVEGYRCFGKRMELDLTDKKNYRFGVECVRGDFLDKMVIIGVNNAGKTSLGYAMIDIASMAGGFSKDIGQNNRMCFLNLDSDSKVATFHYELSQKGSVVTYEYSKSSPDRIESEKLLVDKRVVFSYDLRDSQEIQIDSNLLNMRNIPMPDGRKSMILLLSESNNIDPDSPVRAVLSFATHSLFYMAMWKMDVHLGLIDEEDDAESYIIRNNLIQEFNQFLRDDCMVDIDLISKDNQIMVRKGEGATPFSESVSRGTMILCRLFCWVKRCRDRDALIFFDDFDDMFHYRTAENAIKKIISNNRAQCIFVTHNTGLVSNDFLRPDCCFIMDDGELRSLASLTDKDIRRGHNLEKMLREGEFDQRLN